MSGNIQIDYSKTLNFISQADIDAYTSEVEKYLKAVYQKTGQGSDFLGWVNLPSSIKVEDLKDI